MIWKRSLPARVALATAGMLSLLLIIISFSAYALTAILLRQGVDQALRGTIPLVTRDLPGHLARPQEIQPQDPGARMVQVIDSNGRLLQGSGQLPVDPAAVAVVGRRRIAFSSAALSGGRLQVRTGPPWWQALVPAEREIRVIYVPTGPPREMLILQIGMPLGPSGDILPMVFLGLMGLSLVGILLSAAITWRMVGATYRPLRAIMNIAGSVTTKTLAVRIPSDWQDDTLDRLTEVLNEMMARLQDAFETQGRFVSSAAHELRGPLAAMRAELEVTLRRTRTPEEYTEALSGAVEETERLTALAEHLLILARFERGATLAMEQDLPLAPLLERVAAEVRRSTGQEVRLTVSPNLRLSGDPIALERMVANLVRNGLEADGAPVQIEAGQNLGEVWIAVCDHGTGIPPESVPFLFEPFYRVDPARRRDAGLGLGLAIVKTVVDAHNGQIEVQSVPEGGTKFLVRLPVS